MPSASSPRLPWRLPALLLWALLLPAVAVQAESLTHQVVAGDSLSKLAKRYLGDAGRWREIWALNPQIRTPSSLTLGQAVRLPPAASGSAPSATAVNRTEKVVAAATALPLATRLSAQEALNSAELAKFPEHYRLASGREIADHLRIEALRETASGPVLVASGFDQAYRIGARYALYKPLAALGAGQGQDASRLLQRIGVARLTAQEGSLLRLDLEHLHQTDLSQAFLLPLWHAPTLKGVAPQPSGLRSEGRILQVIAEEPAGYVTLLDRGLDAQVRPGDVLRYIKPDALPGEAGGTLVVFYATEQLSFARVINARRLPAASDRISP